MRNISLYRAALGCASADQFIEDFLASLAPTNRTYSYFVDWEKVRKRIDQVKVELNILNSLMDCTTASQVEKRLAQLIKAYPNVVRALPPLIAIRDASVQVLTDIQDPEAVLHVRFDEEVKDDPDALDALLKFCRHTGIFDLFYKEAVDDLLDYVYGVEVGLDTHAHKNRSGEAMQNLLTPMIADLCNEVGLQCIPECTRRRLEQERYRPPMVDRKMDYVLCRPGQATGHVNIETNYFGVSGSKPDVITGYFDRQELLRADGWHFVLVTDGPAWQGMRSLLHEAVNRLDYVMNLDQVRRGMLRAVLQHVRQ